MDFTKMLGREVFSVIKGKGIIVKIDNSPNNSYAYNYPVIVEFDGSTTSFSSDGRRYKDDKYSELYLEEPQFLKDIKEKIRNKHLTSLLHGLKVDTKLIIAFKAGIIGKLHLATANVNDGYLSVFVGGQTSFTASDVTPIYFHNIKSIEVVS